uniref:Uncharacterized protein n=1 Tax=Arundo donax TaxID=35708 RepID=A0A0A9B212_ARUDO
MLSSIEACQFNLANNSGFSMNFTNGHSLAFSLSV